MNICRIKNNSLTESRVLHTKEFAPGEIYQIQDYERISWANNDAVLIAIVEGTFSIWSETSEMFGITNSVNWLKNFSEVVDVKSQNPFASKILPDGRKLFRRVHGDSIQLNANGNTILEFPIPYAECKINACELICSIDYLAVDFEIYTLTGVKLNQFGFDVNVLNGLYRDESPYDADLTNQLKIVVTFKNPSSAVPVVGVNFILHEVVAA